jgi:hypothetical protein
MQRQSHHHDERDERDLSMPRHGSIDVFRTRSNGRKIHGKV